MIDLSGKVFGKLTVLGKSLERKRGILSWECACECGKKIVRTGTDLRNGDVKHCGCSPPRQPKDISNIRYGSLVALERLGRSGNGDFRWMCKCDCGNDFTPTIGQLNDGRATSCGCKTFEKQSAAQTVHGMSRTPEHNSWLHAKERILNPNNPEYPAYGGAGLAFESEWHDFTSFIAHIGLMPADGKKYSVDRIKNHLGYIRGNVRWATKYQQARNKTFQQNNTSGVNGVMWDNKKNSTGEILYAKAFWNDIDGKQNRKLFSVKKFGLLPSFKLACEYREKMIAQLNAQGAGYSDKHGK